MRVRIERRLAGQDLTGIGKRTDPGRLMDATAAPILASPDRLGDMQPDPDASSEASPSASDHDPRMRSSSARCTRLRP